jgi:hypothetical protein
LTAFDSLPPHHKTFRAADGGSALHLKVNEFAVIDTTDRQLQKGELYLIQYESGERNARAISEWVAVGASNLFVGWRSWQPPTN